MFSDPQLESSDIWQFSQDDSPRRQREVRITPPGSPILGEISPPRPAVSRKVAYMMTVDLAFDKLYQMRNNLKKKKGTLFEVIQEYPDELKEGEGIKKKNQEKKGKVKKG